AAAYVRLGDVLGRMSDANLGDRQGALKSYGKARELLETAVAQRPGDAEPRRRLARLLLSVITAQGFDLKASPPMMAQAMATWEGLVREDPANEDNLRGLASAHFSAFLQVPLSERKGAVVHMQAALETFEKLLAARPADLDRKRNVSLCHKYLATHY